MISPRILRSDYEDASPAPQLPMVQHIFALCERQPDMELTDVDPLLECLEGDPCSLTAVSHAPRAAAAAANEPLERQRTPDLSVASALFLSRNAADGTDAKCFTGRPICSCNPECDFVRRLPEMCQLDDTPIWRNLAMTVTESSSKVAGLALKQL
jgi:hypothetical protein